MKIQAEVLTRTDTALEDFYDSTWKKNNFLMEYDLIGILHAIKAPRITYTVADNQKDLSIGTSRFPKSDDLSENRAEKIGASQKIR